MATPVLHVTDGVVQQYKIDGVFHRFIALVEDHVEGDPDKLKLAVYSTVNSPKNLLTVGWNSGIVSQHGRKGQHATFRYKDE